MVSLVRATPLDFNDRSPDAVRKAVRQLLMDDPKATRRIYAAFGRKVWTLLVERRFDRELRDWQNLLQDVRAKIEASDTAAAERLVALADLLKESISLGEVSPARRMIERPKAQAILRRLAKSHGFTKRRDLLGGLSIGSSHLSNVLTQLLAHNLVERRGSGREAEYRLTRLGRDLLGAPAEITVRPVETIREVQLKRILKVKAARASKVQDRDQWDVAWSKFRAGPIHVAPGVTTVELRNNVVIDGSRLAIRNDAPPVVPSAIQAAAA